MINKYKPISGKLQHFMHGGDYNPDQWLKYPEILQQDIRLMKLSKCNVMTIGIFAWVTLEPEEGKFNFKWLDDIIDKLYKNGIYVILSTPTGARPAWMSYKYPQVLRVNSNRVRNIHGGRHNHCYTSPIYREKTKIINSKLAERYSNHPGIVGWHISNEYGGECHCPLCQNAFRDWLKEKYKSLDNLNESWWTTFWSHTYTDWSQVESPSPQGEQGLHGLNLDWKRFVTYQTIDFFKCEIKQIKEINSNIPITTNFMGTYYGLDYWKFAKEVDVVSWDNYPLWHTEIDDVTLASQTSMVHDLARSLKGGKPFMLMESSPSSTNWQAVSKLKKPKMHLLSSIQAVAHGSDTVQYFQWRKSRGSSEKFHGAVVDHCGHENTRVFNDVTDVGTTLEKLDEILATYVEPDVAIVFDWENWWAIDDAQGPRNYGIKYKETIEAQYKSFWKQGVPVDLINMDCDFSKYKMVVAPMLYMVRTNAAKRLESFVENGGILVSTYWSGIVNENDLCFLGGFPGPLRKVLGIWSEEIDALTDEQYNSIIFNKSNELGLADEFKCIELCDLIHTETAETLAVYGNDFYKGRAVVTVNSFGKGKAYYIATRTKEDFNDAFYGSLVDKFKIKHAINSVLPYGVTAQLRTNGKDKYIFLMNFSKEEKKVEVDDYDYYDFFSKEKINKNITLSPYDFIILKKYI